jgi:hypothetical protein
MALDFPISPTANQVYFDATSGNRYRYDSTNGIWRYYANTSGSVNYVTSNGAGRLWANTITSGIFQNVYIDLATSGVTANNYGGSTTIPTFTVDAYGRITAASNSGLTAVTSVATGVGLTGGTITSTGTLSLATYSTATNVAVSGGISSITVDEYGRVRAVSGSAGYGTGTVTSVTATAGVSNVTVGGTAAAPTIGLTSVSAGGTLTGGISTITFDVYGRVTSATGSAGYGTGNMLLSGNQTVTGGFSLTPYSLGSTIASFTVTPSNGNYQYGTNNGAFTITSPASDCAVDIMITNGASAGAITFSGFTAPSGGGGDTYATTNASKFLLMIRRIGSTSTYVWKALQ